MRNPILGLVATGLAAFLAADHLKTVDSAGRLSWLGEYYASDAYLVSDGVKVYVRGARTVLSETNWAPPSDVPKVIYGTDDRIDYYAEIDPDRLNQAESTCALVSNFDINDNGNGTFTLLTSAYGVCDTEPFADQPTAAFCTGFLVGPDLIATAGHCYDTSDLSSVSFVFGFHMLDATTPALTLSNAHRYHGVEVVGRALSANLDYAVVRLDRAVTAPGAEPLPIRRTGTVSNGTGIGVIGHPSGLPKKIAFGEETQVYDNVPTGYFVANLDTYGGNSGSPVFNAATGEVEGILVRGAPDFIFNGDCFVSNELPDSEAAEEVSKSTTFMQFIPELPDGEGVVSFDAQSYGCSDTVTIEVADANLAGSTSVLVTTSSGDSETVVLAQVAGSAGFFRGDIPVFESPPSIQNGILNVADGDTITATYTDANPIATVNDTALVDCAPVSEYFTEFFGGDFDLEGLTLTFTPDASDDGYSVCSSPTSSFPSNMSGATALTLADDSFQQILLLNGNTVKLYGVPYSTCYVGSNGYITFGSGDTEFQAGLGNHFFSPRVSGYFTDLAPNTGGSVLVKQFTNRLAVAFVNVRQYFSSNVNTFQIELFYDGDIRMTWLDIRTSLGLVGLSPGGGTPDGFVESELSSFADCDVEQIRNDFVSFDSNGDGRLNLSESGLSSGTFNTLDTNNDSFITMAELLLATIGSAGAAPVVYLDFGYVGIEEGSAARPFNSLAESVGFVQTNGEIWISPGSTPNGATLDKALILKRNGNSGTVTIGAL